MADCDGARALCGAAAPCGSAPAGGPPRYDPSYPPSAHVAVRDLDIYAAIIAKEGVAMFTTEAGLITTLGKGLILLTSNQSLGAWGEVYGDSVIASVILDRLLHHATTVNIKRDSYRLKEERRAGLLRPAPTSEPAE
jgi:hypothetical protein